jgi:hypothetical protein
MCSLAVSVSENVKGRQRLRLASNFGQVGSVQIVSLLDIAMYGKFILLNRILFFFRFVSLFCLKQKKEHMLLDICNIFSSIVQTQLLLAFPLGWTNVR